ncbi:uncharacterized protein LOC117897504 [Drosophila subobscura]|uniref:uncharacterized protein LOC117897504 n=1 Tax=Drosophila subobscura TaxID=7241 RepID=UPI00155B3E66|nr:uncharacterized protein LOC117897504 [Drosophila subobscura]
MAQRGKLNQWLRHSISNLKRVFRGDSFIEGQVGRPTTLPATAAGAPRSSTSKQGNAVEEKSSSSPSPSPEPLQGASFCHKLFRKALGSAECEVLSMPKQSSINKSAKPLQNAKDEAPAAVSSVDILVTFYGTQTAQNDALTTATPTDVQPEVAANKSNSKGNSSPTLHAERELRLKIICLPEGLPVENNELKRKTLNESPRNQALVVPSITSGSAPRNNQNSSQN